MERASRQRALYGSVCGCPKASKTGGHETLWAPPPAGGASTQMPQIGNRMSHDATTLEPHTELSARRPRRLGVNGRLYRLRGACGDFGLFDSGRVDGAIGIFELCAFQI
eukprot:6558068-Prymnesium_polylepis.1